MKRELERMEIPGEHDARRRSWETVRAAFAEREPVAWPRRHVRTLALAAAAVALTAAVLSPPGRSVVDSVRRTIGVEHAERQLFTLPAPGRLLVQSNRGAWVVQRDGSRRLLGGYRDASWSPRGRFVAGILNGHTLVALEPDGAVHWEKPERRRLTSPRWSFEGYRIAYFAGRTVRVVNGDSTGDVVIGSADPTVAPAWRPGTHEVAYVTRKGVVLIENTDTRVVSRRLDRRGAVRALHWSTDGRELLVTRARSVDAYFASGRTAASLRVSKPGTVSSTAFRPGTHEFALAYRDPTHPDRSLVCLERRSRVVVRGGVRHVHGGGCVHVFEGAASFPSLTWSPNGKWLLVAWPAADQYVFVRVGTAPKLTAVSDVSRQFHSDSFPEIAGWVG